MRYTIALWAVLVNACGATPPIVWQTRSGGFVSDEPSKSVIERLSTTERIGAIVAIASIAFMVADNADEPLINVATTTITDAESNEGSVSPWH